ncbi:MAG TPA: phosphatase domain-containing protein [Gemmatimonadaceae bacterium]|nr:phosphatase domain-containing protein [Gemmatimonadaceae bacterium]
MTSKYEILAYRGYGNATKARFYGRVVEKIGASASTDRDSLFRNLLNTWRRVDSDPVGHARVTVDYAGTRIDCKADSEGFLAGWLDAANAPGNEWESYGVAFPDKQAEGKGEILIPPASAKFGVISDIDDTVIQSRVSNFLQAARTVMLGNARTRLPFPGVAAFYQALRKGAGGDDKNPVFYVSSSPWNIYDVITEFMDIQKIPKGPLMLRDWDIDLSALSAWRHFEHKGVAIQNLMAVYPSMKFILIGDSSQQDPEIYRQIVGQYPERVLCIYIRDVNRDAERKASIEKLAKEILDAGSSLVLAEDTLGASEHAVKQGWIHPESLPDIHEEKKADEGRNDEKVAAPDGGEPVSGEPPKVIS